MFRGRPKVEFHFWPKPKVGRKWRNTFGRNRMCHRKWSGPFCRKPKPKVNCVWADKTMEASKSHTASVAQLSCASDIFHSSYPHGVSLMILPTRLHSTRCRRRQRSCFLAI